METTIHYLSAEASTEGYLVRRIAISGLVALAAVLGGGAVPATAMTQPTAAVRADSAVAVRADCGSRDPRDRRSRDAYDRKGAGGRRGSRRERPPADLVRADDGLPRHQGQFEPGRRRRPSTPTRVARWNGSSWKGVGVALPKGTKSDDLLGVSCKGAKSCLVVGDYYTSTSNTATSHALALSYNGTSLKPTPTVPLPKGMPYAALTGVSCVTTRYCVAVGTASSPPFGDHREQFGHHHRDVERREVDAAHHHHARPGKEVEIDGVSCATSAFCVVTGTSDNLNSANFNVNLYFASWNGKKLTTMKPTAVGSSLPTSWSPPASRAPRQRAAP